MPDNLSPVMILGNSPGEKTGKLELISEAGVSQEIAAVRDALVSDGRRVLVRMISDAEDLIRDIRASKISAVFNLCEGLAGDSELEMHIASLLRLSGVPYTGNNPLVLGIAHDKALTKRILREAGISVPAGLFFNRIPEKLPGGLRFPMICKPACEDASLGITAESFVRSESELIARVGVLLESYPRGVLAEEYIEGREFNVALIPENGTLRALPPSEIDFSQLAPDQPRITTYEAKWLEDSAAYRGTPAVCPARIPSELARRLQFSALSAAGALGADSYGRADLRLSPEGEIFVLEYNPNPDISPDAGFAKALSAASISYAEFVRMVLRQGVSRNRGGKID